ncbi:hypothetical protein ABC347_05925 [Sphingomonas sp. 1P06PA]
MPPPDPEPRSPEPAFGPDEEGELPLEPDAIPEDEAAWVHVDRKPPAD